MEESAQCHELLEKTIAGFPEQSTRVLCVKVRKRTRARELAVQALYQYDLRNDLGCEDLRAFIERSEDDPAVTSFARLLVEGCIEQQGEIDRSIQDVAENWELGRMAHVDRNILRIAVFELKYLDDVPPKVSINEAVELAKRFSTAGSGAFVNGILDRIRRDMEGAGHGDS